jgi:protein-histidine N-methyltransferase
MAFSFSFSGEDIQDTEGERVSASSSSRTPSTAEPASSASAFPVQGKPLLPAIHHDLDSMLSKLPSQVAYSTLTVDLDGQGTVTLPRRELWDVRVQLMAEEDEEEAPELEPGLGNHDVKTGIYEGGFKSWESSVDMVKVLASEGYSESLAKGPCRVIEVRQPLLIGRNPR